MWNSHKSQVPNSSFFGVYFMGFTQNAFVIYGSLGQPLVYVVKTYSDEFTQDEMVKLMELFDGVENAETLVTLEEVV